MHKSPLVTVVVPTYNRGPLLKRAVKSVIKQTHPAIELLVVDDCSDNPAADVLSPFSLDSLDNYSFIRHETNQGVCAARNTGIKEATGDFVAFLDDDDVWDPTKLEKQVRTVQNSGRDAGLVYAGVEQRTHDGAVIGVKTPSINGDVSRSLLYGNFIGTYSTVLIRTEVLEKVGLLDERYPSWHDWEHYLRIGQQRCFEAVPEPLVTRYSGHEQNSDGYRTRRDVDSVLLVNQYSGIASQWGALTNRKFESAVEFALAQSAYSNQLYDEARKHLLTSIRQYPLQPRAYIYFGLLLGGEYTFKPARAAKQKLTNLRSELKWD